MKNMQIDQPHWLATLWVALCEKGFPLTHKDNQDYDSVAMR